MGEGRGTGFTIHACSRSRLCTLLLSSLPVTLTPWAYELVWPSSQVVTLVIDRCTCYVLIDCEETRPISQHGTLRHAGPSRGGRRRRQLRAGEGQLPGRRGAHRPGFGWCVPRIALPAEMTMVRSASASSLSLYCRPMGIQPAAALPCIVSLVPAS